MPEPNVRARALARTVSALYLAAAVVSLGLVMFGSAARRREPWIEIAFEIFGLPVAPSFLVAAVVAVIGTALVARKRVAWWLALVTPCFTVMMGVTDILSFPGDWAVDVLSVAEIVGSLAMLALLLVTRPAFSARLRRGSFWRALGTAAAGGVITVGSLALAIVLTPLGDRGSFSETMLSGVTWALGIRDDQPFPRAWAAVPVVIGLLGAVTVVAAVAVFFGDGRPAATWSPEREIRLREILARWGSHDSLSYFATRRDKNLYFSDDGQAVVAAAPFAGVLLASGDPIGPRESWRSAIVAFISEARRHGCLPGVASVSEEGARAFVAAGMSAVPLGDEAVLEASQFSLNRSGMADVRAAVRRARRAGVEVDICRQRDLDEATLHAVLSTAAEWRHGETERGYSMSLGRFGDPTDAGNLLVIARNEGAVVGLLQLSPWGARDFSLDLMRRCRTSPNGTMELMVSELMSRSHALGITKISLNFAFLRQTFADAERVGAAPWTRINSHLLSWLDRFFQIESLYRSNQKYAPQWVPRFICFESAAALPRVLLAMARAEGYLGRRQPPTTPPPPELVAAADRIAAAPLQLEADTEVHRLREERLAHAASLVEHGHALHPLDVGKPWRPGQLTPDMFRRHDEVRVAARVWRKRDHGGVLFLDLRDGSATLQVAMESGVPDQRLAARTLDRGDIIVVEGALGASRTGSPVLHATGWELASKTLDPLPLTRPQDPDLRARDRVTDLLLNPPGLDLLRQRSAIVSATRDVLRAHGFGEVETPQLVAVHGGASARPFRTMANAYGMELCLRIAPELALKQLIVAGMGPIYEIGRNFRNEGADATHNPEFTSLEAYQPWADYTTMRLLTEDILTTAATAVHGSAALPLRQPDGTYALTDCPAPWRVRSVCEAVSEAVGEEVSVDGDFDRLTALAMAHDIRLRPTQGPGAIIEELYGQLVEPVTVEPTFYVDFPAETSPLTAPHRSLPGLAERWDLVINGMEVGTAYSELTDPVLQRRVLTAQSLAAAAGDPEAMEVDETFLHALEVGMPPTGGLGLGVDRMVMAITGVTIRDALAFPFVRPRSR